MRQVPGETPSADLLDLQMAMEAGSLQEDWLGDFMDFFSATSNFTAERLTWNAPEELIASRTYAQRLLFLLE